MELADLAVRLGYSDQSHLSNDFRGHASKPAPVFAGAFAKSDDAEGSRWTAPHLG